MRIKELDDRDLPKKIYNSIISFLPRLNRTAHGETYPKHQADDGRIKEPYMMPFYSYADVIREFEDAVYAFEEEHPEFQLNHYSDVLLLNGIHWEINSILKADVSQMCGQTVMALILGAIRAERFCPGALNRFFELGCIQRWLQRLAELDNQS